MKHWRGMLMALAGVAVLGAVGGLSTVFFGLYNTSARGGHWPITEWVLHTTFENAVALRAPAEEEVPDLSDPALIELGARHYESACVMCHASPGQVATATIANMEPLPPQIDTAVAPWTPPELHWIVHEGVKMSGMPAWPSAAPREDEVWAVVAFLTSVQEGMDAERYATLTEDNMYCSGCHNDRNSHVPRLGILSPAYIEASLHAYRDGSRSSGIMAQAASVLSPDTYAQFAQRVGTTAPAGPAPDAPALATQGQGNVPACLACHGERNENPLIPTLNGQSREYLAAQLRLWRDGVRGGTERAPIMAQAAKGLSEEDIAALADYFAALP